MVLAKVGVAAVVDSRSRSGSVNGTLVGGKEAGVGTEGFERNAPALLGPILMLSWPGVDDAFVCANGVIVEP